MQPLRTNVALLIAALLGMRAPVALAEPKACYDALLVGRIVEAKDIVALNALAPHDKNHLQLGFRARFLVKVERSLAGDPLHGEIWMRGVLTDMLSPKTRLLLFLKRTQQGDYWIEDLSKPDLGPSNGQGEAAHGPPACDRVKP